jgi:hypothetical protein
MTHVKLDTPNLTCNNSLHYNHILRWNTIFPVRDCENYFINWEEKVG